MKIASGTPREFGQARRFGSILGALIFITLGLVGGTGPAAAAGSDCASVGVTATPMQGSNKPFYISTSSSLMSGSVGWALSGSPATSVFAAGDLWLKLASFSDTTTLDKNSLQAQSFSVRGHTTGGSNGLAAGLPVAYAYLTALKASATAQTFNVEVWHGDPSLSTSNVICNFTDGVSSVEDVIVASANQPTAITFNRAPVLGGEFTMTVTGATGTIGSGPAGDPRVFLMAPSMGQTWPAAGFALIEVKTTFSSGTPLVLNDFLRVNFADSATRNYSTEYTFLVRKSVNTATTPTPRMNIASGTQVKMSNTLSGATAIPASTNPVTDGILTQTVTSSTDWDTGVTTYTLTLNNTGSTRLCADAVLVTPPSGWTYVDGSATLDGSAWEDPAIASGKLTFPSLCVPGPGTTVVTFQADITTSTDITVGLTSGGETLTSESSGTASLKVNVMSTGTATGGGAISEIYDGVTVAIAKDGGAFGYKPALVTNALGEADFGQVDPDASYTIKLTAPCDNQPSSTKAPIAVTTGAYTPTQTLAATVPCAPVMSYTAGTNTLSWTEPNDGGSHISYYTHHYKAPVAATWGMFARFWPADTATPAARTIPLTTYGPVGGPCPTKGVTAWPTANWGPAPYTNAPECLRARGSGANGSAWQWRVAARNALSTSGNTVNNGTGWSPYSNTVN